MHKIICPCSHFISKRQPNTIKFTKQKLLKSMHWSEYKTKSEIKKATNEYRYFLESNFVKVNRLFELV